LESNRTTRIIQPTKSTPPFTEADQTWARIDKEGTIIYAGHARKNFQPNERTQIRSRTQQNSERTATISTTNQIFYFKGNPKHNTKIVKPEERLNVTYLQGGH
jgi:hypothetical protein